MWNRVILVLICALCSLHSEESPQTFAQIKLSNGDTIHNATVKSQDAMTVTFWADEGVFKIRKPHLPPELAKLFPYDAEAARKEVQEAEARAIEFQARQRLKEDNLRLFNENAVQLEIRSIRGQDGQGVYVEAEMLGGFKERKTHKISFLGRETLGDVSTYREKIDLGSIYLRGITVEEATNAKKPVYACYIGASQATESAQTILGFDSREVTISGYTTIKSEAGDYYRNQEALKTARGE